MPCDERDVELIVTAIERIGSLCDMISADQAMRLAQLLHQAAELLEVRASEREH